MKYFTKFAGLAAGLVLLGSAFAPAAQASTLNSTQISAILSLLNAFGASQSVINNVSTALNGSAAPAPSYTSPQPAASGMTTDVALVCNASANLKRGDTDATTGGRVSTLQQMLGISPTTGFYGPLTGIGYTNKCIGGNAQPVSVAGMSQYTDSSFGFSFWYPSSWTVTPNYTKPSSCWSGGTFVKSLVISGNSKSITLNEITSPSGVIYGCGVAYDQYYFNSTAGVWMYKPKWATYAEGTPGTPQAADVSQNTMGGLHIFGGEVVPLSADNFVIGDANDTTGITSTEPAAALINTILATDSTVANPVSTAQQTATIQAEASVYGVSSASSAPTNASSSVQTYANQQYGFSLQYPSSFTPVTPLPTPFMGWVTLPNTLLTLYYTGGQNMSGFDSANITFAANSTATYEDCTRVLSSSSGGQSATKQVTVNGLIFYEDSTGDAATGHYSSGETYRTYYNGACYEIASNINTSRTNDGASPGDTTSVSSALQAVLNSLTFTSPNSASALHASVAPTWSTFVGQQTPTSFTYPGSFFVYESENESDVDPGTKAGLQTFQSSISAGAIAVQMTPSKYFPAGDSAAQAMQVAMKTEAIGSSVYQSISLGGETAYTRSDSVATGFSVIYVAHGGAYYRILLMNPLLPQEYQNFVSSFHFTQ